MKATFELSKDDIKDAVIEWAKSRAIKVNENSVIVDTREDWIGHGTMEQKVSIPYASFTTAD